MTTTNRPNLKALLFQIEHGRELIEPPSRPADFEQALAELSENDRSAVLDQERELLAALADE